MNGRTAARIVVWTVAAFVACNGPKTKVTEEVATGDSTLRPADGGDEVSPVDVGNDNSGKQDICIPSCEGKECGHDGCGGSCGECEDGRVCVEDSYGAWCYVETGGFCESDYQCRNYFCGGLLKNPDI